MSRAVSVHTSRMTNYNIMHQLLKYQFRFQPALFFVLICTLFWFNTAFGQNSLGFNIRPASSTVSNNAAYFDYEIEPGNQINDEIEVVNTSNQPISLIIYPAEAQPSDNGGLTFGDRETNMGSTGRWLDLEQIELTLAPKDSRLIPFKVNIPPEITSGEYVAGIVAEQTNVNQTNSDQGIGATFVPRTAATVLVTVPGPQTAELSITKLEGVVQGNRKTAITHLFNSGNIGLKPHGSIEIFDQAGQLLDQQAIQLGYFMPQGELTYPVFLPDGEQDQSVYRVVVELNYGEEVISEIADLTFETTKTTPSATPTYESVATTTPQNATEIAVTNTPESVAEARGSQEIGENNIASALDTETQEFEDKPSGLNQNLYLAFAFMVSLLILTGCLIYFFILLRNKRSKTEQN